MYIYEYQAKEIMKKYGLPVPSGRIALTPEEAEGAAKAIAASAWVVKAQVYTGGRGKAGGIRTARSLAEVKQAAEEILNAPLKTAQSGARSKKVKKVLIEERCELAKELYFAVAVDRTKGRVVCIVSPEGGVEIEETAKNNRSAVFKEYIAPLKGLVSCQARSLAIKLGIKERAVLGKVIRFIVGLYEIFIRNDCLLAEINPLAVTKRGTVTALDAKFSFDDSALCRHPEIAAMRDEEEEPPAEKAARKSGLSYIGLGGNIGCMVNGAGLAMATMDTIKAYGGEPANFLDVGGGASADAVAKAFEILTADKKVKVILVNIFGGILKCDVLAEGIIAATEKSKPSFPLVVRLEGTNVERGRQILKNSGLNLISEETMEGAAERAVSLAGK